MGKQNGEVGGTVTLCGTKGALGDEEVNAREGHEGVKKGRKSNRGRCGGRGRSVGRGKRATGRGGGKRYEIGSDRFNSVAIAAETGDAGGDAEGDAEGDAGGGEGIGMLTNAERRWIMMARYLPIKQDGEISAIKEAVQAFP